MRLIVESEDFAEWFNKAIPGAYSSITAQDVRDITTCGLIGCYGYYMQLRQNRQKRNEIRDDDRVIHCRRCGAVMDRPKGKERPREYCAACESSRSTMRNRKWRSKMKAARNRTMCLLVTSTLAPPP